MDLNRNEFYLNLLQQRNSVWNVNSSRLRPAGKVILKISVWNDVLAEADILKNQNRKEYDDSIGFHFISSFQISATLLKAFIKITHKSHNLSVQIYFERVNTWLRCCHYLELL